MDLTDHHDSVPEDRSTVPYVDGCSDCDGLHAEGAAGHPFSWLSRAATHFAVAHQLKIFTSKAA